MSINLSHPSQKQSLLAIIGIGIAVVLLLVLGGVYGRFLKTQVAAPQQGYVASGNLLTAGLEPGSYVLKFVGRDAAGGSASATTTFGILASATPTPAVSEVPTLTPVVTATPLPAY